MDKVDDRANAQPLHLGHDGIQQAPVVLARPFENAMNRRAVAEISEPEIAHELQIFVVTVLIGALASAVLGMWMAKRIVAGPAGTLFDDVKQ